MFSAKTKDSHKQEMIKLTNAEQSKLDQYLLLILYFNTNAVDELAELQKTIEKYTPRDIYKFSENSTTFKIFIQRDDCPLTQDWKEFLKEKKYIGEPVISLDKKIKHSLFDQYIGAFLFDDYINQNKEPNKNGANALLSLDLACELNLFQAITTRLDHCQKKIRTAKDDKERVLALGQVLADTKRLNSLYGSMGYFHSALVLTDIGNYYYNLSHPHDNTATEAGKDDKLENTNNIQELLLTLKQTLIDIKNFYVLYGSVGYLYLTIILKNIVNSYDGLDTLKNDTLEEETENKHFIDIASIFYEAAAESYFCGKELVSKQLPENEKILKAICKDDGLNIFGFSTWDEADDYFLSSISAQTNQQKIRDAAKEIVANLLEPKKPTLQVSTSSKD